MTAAEQPSLDAALRLTVAIDQLTQPGHHTLDRNATLTAQARTEADTAHLGHCRVLRWKLTQARDQHDHDRLTGALREAGRRHRAHRASLTAQHAVLPSLLDQLVDAVESTGGSGSASRGVHRSPLNAAASELITDIARTISCRHFDNHRSICLRDWAGDFDRDLADAEHAERWVTDARAIIEPARYTEAKAPCPICHTRRVRVIENGEPVIKAAIQVNLTRGHATCIAPGCTGRWDRAHFKLLAGILEQDRDERAARKTRP